MLTPQATNRTGLTVHSPDIDGMCQTSVMESSRDWSFDSGQRLLTSGTNYDMLGRTTGGVDADTTTGDAPLQVGYYANDMVRSLTRGDAEATYTLDASAGRFRTVTLDHPGESTTRTNHYSTDGDSPSGTDEGGWYSRMIAGLGGIVGIYHGHSGTIEWKITNLHGDFVATISGTAAGLTATHESDEYGQPRAGSSAGRYGWLGAAQRAGDNPGDLITMGARDG